MFRILFVASAAAAAIAVGAAAPAFADGEIVVIVDAAPAVVVEVAPAADMSTTPSDTASSASTDAGASAGVADTAPVLDAAAVPAPPQEGNNPPWTGDPLTQAATLAGLVAAFPCAENPGYLYPNCRAE